jgi:ABC-type bacteriocin/lantibiotic exporter with double-glycine peptidase domain
VYGVIEDKSLIDARTDGIKEVPKGEIEFSKVDFQYPSRNLNVLKNFTLTIHSNTSVAIVGYSGCGKSTLA